MRTVKDAKERKNEILDAAGELFAAKGYDATSTGDILERCRIARGTLYYHFSSKEEILDALIDRIGAGLIANAGAISRDKSIPVAERIVKTVSSLNVESEVGMEVLKEVHKPQNALMHQKMQKTLMDDIAPILTRLAEEGIEEGLFFTPFPKEAVEMLVVYSGTVFDEDFEQSKEEFEKRVGAFIYNTERLLGAKSGSLAKQMKKLF